MICFRDKPNNEGSIIDPVIPHLEGKIITNDNAVAIKYANGIMICAGKYEGTSSPLADYFGQFKRTSENMKVIFPETFLEEPKIIVTPFYNSYICCLMINSISTENFGFTGLKANSVPSSNTTVGIEYIAIGKWK